MALPGGDLPPPAQGQAAAGRRRGANVIVSASALRRNCGYPRALNRERKPTADQQAAMDRGTVFHQAIETWARTRELPVVPDLEMQGWLDLLAADWHPPLDGEYEVAWGLRAELSDGVPPAYVEVDEPEPHVYVPRRFVVPAGQTAQQAMGAALLTAGRADVAWWSGDGLVVADWKTGRYPATPAPQNLQVNAAGIALALKRGASSYVPMIYYARDGYWDHGPRVVFGTPAFERIWGEIRSAALLDERPRPGEWCADCWDRRTKRCAYAAYPGAASI